MAHRPSSAGFRLVSALCIFLQLHAPILFAADPTKPAANAPAAIEPLGPSDETIARIFVQQLGADNTKKVMFLSALELTRDTQVGKPDDYALEPEVKKLIEAWLDKFPTKTRKVPAELLALDPNLQAKVDEGHRLMRLHYHEQITGVDKYLSDLPDPLADAERRLLMLMKQARLYREAKISELEAKRMAAEATRRRTGIPPEVSRQLMESKALLTDLEYSIHRHNIKMHGALTEYFRDETRFKTDSKFPPQMLKIWAEDTKKNLKAAQEKSQPYLMAAINVRNLNNDFTVMGGLRLADKIATPAGAQLVMARIRLESDDNKKLAETMAKVEATDSLASQIGTKPYSPDKLLTEIQLQRESHAVKREAYADFYAYNFVRGEIVVPPANDSSSDIKIIRRPWLTALAWYRKSIEQKEAAEGKSQKATDPPKLGNWIYQRLAFGLPTPKITIQSTPKNPTQRRSSAAVLKWAVALGLGLGLAAVGGNYVSPHLPTLVTLPLPSLTQVDSGASSLTFSEAPHIGQNFDLGSSSFDDTPSKNRPRYLLKTGSDNRLEQLPTEFEFSYLNERHKPLTDFSFTPSPSQKSDFQLKTEKELQANQGWFPIATAPGYETRAEIKVGSRVLREGVDYKVYRTVSGGLLAKILSADARANLEVEASFFRKTTPPNAIPEKDLYLSATELARLTKEAEFMEKEGLTVWAKSLRERTQKAQAGEMPLKITDLAEILRKGTYYPEFGSGKIVAAHSDNPWSMLRDLPREEGKLVGQCSVSESALHLLIERIAPRFGSALFTMGVETRDADSIKVGKDFGHRYLVFKLGSYDGIALDATSGEVHPKYAAPAVRSMANGGDFLTLHTLGYSAAGILGLAALGGGAWYLRRGRALRLTPAEELEAKADRENFKAQLDGAVLSPALETEKQAGPTADEIELAALKRRNAKRHAMAASLERLTDRLIIYGDTLGADPGRKDRSLPFPRVAHAARLLREFSLGQSEYRTEAKLVEALADVFGLSHEERLACEGKVSKSVQLGMETVKKTRAAYLVLHPEEKDSPNLSEPLFRELSGVLEFMSRERWTAYEREPNQSPVGCKTSLSSLALPKSSGSAKINVASEPPWHKARTMIGLQSI